jgi:hypothetical protein
MAARASYRGGDGCRPSEDADGRGHLSPGPGGRGWQASYSRHLPWTRSVLCPHRLGRSHPGQIRVLCYQYAGESGSGLQAAGSPANWRCIALEKLSRVELLEGAWQTAPNHSRPQTCVAEVAVDCED